MFLAVLKAGVLQPLGPLPATLRDGDVVQVELRGRDEAETAESIARDFAELDALCADSTEADEQRLQVALDEIRRIDKEQMRVEMGL